MSMRKLRGRGSIFAEEMNLDAATNYVQQQFPQSNEQEYFYTTPHRQQNTETPHKQHKTKRNRQTPTAPEPIISNTNDSIHLTGENFKPNQSLIDITGFNDLAPFVGNNKSYTLNVADDNTYSDYNETGSNNINDSEYRRRLIKQMQDSLFQQSQSMFGNMEKAHSNDKNNQYDVESTYTPSRAPSLYLQKQSKRIFRTANEQH